MLIIKTVYSDQESSNQESCGFYVMDLAGAANYLSQLQHGTAYRVYNALPLLKNGKLPNTLLENGKFIGGSTGYPVMEGVA